MNKPLQSLLIGVFLFVVFQTFAFAETKVKLVKAPDNGIQPNVIVDAAGVAHLIYYKGDASSGNIFYRKKESGGGFSTPIPINTIPGSAVSMGTIRGAKFALDNDSRVHVVWNGSRITKQEGQHGPPMFYTRLKEDGSGFEEQRIITGHWPVDGGGAIGVDSSNRVFVFWHLIPLYNSFKLKARRFPCGLRIKSCTNLGI